MMAELTFECPACFGQTVGVPDWRLRVMCSGKFSFEVEIIQAQDEGESEWKHEPHWADHPDIHEAFETRYYCGTCGYTLKHPETQEPITEDKDLIEWLKAYDRGEVPEI
jgi:hypothetical protein